MPFERSISCGEVGAVHFHTLNILSSLEGYLRSFRQNDIHLEEHHSSYVDAVQTNLSQTQVK